ncbi:centrosomal protein of 120 kDa-like [Microplitis demolitor]|uniref:centrosomal protein of 120 kDa-like n=1 Tax=Microplitis demolitor TaxID=69319 RepID=UPI0004CCA486|nr:centrosomal protein of 120 kDa-like [Microplitis demolitor]
MDQLTGPEVQVVLNLKEGKGFDKVNNPTCIVATLNGLSLETDFIDPEPCPQYTTSLVWEATKSTLRKMRSGQEPLKIECFEYRENGTKDKLGYLLLSLRTAQVVPRGYDGNIKTNWLKLSGLRSDVKADKPEFLLSLTIGERESPGTADSSKKDGVDQVVLPKDLPTPYLINEERLIQLGPVNECRDIFIFSIITETVANIDCLKDRASKIDTDKSYTLWYHVFDNEIQSKPFVYSQSVSLDEKIVIRIRSSLKVIRNYLQYKPYFLILLKHRESVLGQSEVDLRSLVPTDIVEDFLKNSDNGCTVLYEHCLLKTLENREEFVVEDKPFVNIQLKLQYLGSKSTSSQNYFSEIYKRAPYSIDHMVQKSSDIECHRHPVGDYHKCTCEVHNINSCTSRIDRYPSVDLAQRRIEYSHMCNKKDNAKNVGAYHCYCLHITLNSIKLRSEMSIDNIEFRFHHPKAEIMSTVYPKVSAISGDQLRLQDIGCKVHFISASEEIRNLLLSFPPKVSVCDGDKAEKMFVGQSVLDVCRLFDNQMTLNCQYEAPLFDNSFNEIGFIDVSMYLEDHGPYYQTNKRSRDENLGPPILDDSLVYKIVDELETWKERQQEIFRLELKRKEERHLNRLSEEWQKRRESLEAKFNESVEQCKVLANKLNSATDDLRARKLLSLEKETRLIKANEELKLSYDKKFEELKDNSQKVQQDLASKLSQLEEQKQSLLVQVELMRADNSKLEDIIRKQNEELSVFRKGSLMQDQTENLLHELKDLERKLNSAQKSKSFFKEQWGKAVREIHKMKMEHRQAIEVQIKNNKEELKNINLEEILHADSAALNSDKILLGQIQKEIDIIRPKRSYSLLSPEKSFPSTFNSRSQMNFTRRGHSAVSEEQDERLRKLIEERDALLKTKSYTIDDAIIVKLNTEIRSLLVNS